MKKIIFTFISLLLTCTFADAANKYLATTGSDSNDCSTVPLACRTFTKLLSTATPGDTWILLGSGAPTDYGTTASGLFNCNGKSGTSLLPITVRAENPRRSRIIGQSATLSPVSFNNCNWWILQDLIIENTDAGGGSITNPVASGEGWAFWVQNSSDIRIENTIIRKPNRTRYSNSLAGSFATTTNLVFDKVEFLDIVGHGFEAHNTAGTGNRITNSYINTKGYRPAGCTFSGCGQYEPLILYGGVGWTVENTIMEIDPSLELSQYPSGFESVTSNDAFYGNIAINMGTGFSIFHHPDNSCCIAADNIANHNVSIGSVGNGFFFVSMQNLTALNNSSFNSTAAGFLLTNTYSTVNGGSQSVPSPGATIRNFLSSGNATGATVLHTSQMSPYVADDINAFSSATWSGSTTGRTDFTTTDPVMGACRAFIPVSSPMYTSGDAGGRNGAEILFERVNGVPTTNRLWDSSLTGANYGQWLKAGPVISGVNSTGFRAETVHQRLGFGTGGCVLPYLTVTITTNGGNGAGVDFTTSSSSVGLAGTSTLP